mmetsp:Transcript_16053/g.31375  ORF Transcript_16053/g.31375 Transcript_16053/m.31375 type:complete len:305 (+) Transcript_16053:20-934(+)
MAAFRVSQSLLTLRQGFTPRLVASVFRGRRMSTDHFGHDGQAADYAVYRPKYSREIFALIEKYHEYSGMERSLAVDIGTGTGQVAIPLSKQLQFDKVIGVDRSKAQLEHATQLDGVEYAVGDALDIPIDDGRASLLTIAQTMHWLPLSEFFAEVRRVLKIGGTFAVLGYAIPEITHEEIQKEFRAYYVNTLGSTLPVGAPGCYWDCDRVILDSGFESTDFKGFKDVTRTWVKDSQKTSLDAHISYLTTMSAYRTYLQRNSVERGGKDDPLFQFRDKALSVMQAEGLEQLEVIYPYFLILAQREI